MRVKSKVLNVLGILAIALSISPIYLAISSSLKKKSDLSSKWVINSNLTFENYIAVLKNKSFYVSQMNTFIMVFGALAIVIFIGAITGFALARLDTKLSKAISSFSLGVMMVPTINLMVPLYKLLIRLNLVNTLAGAIVTIGTFSLPLSIFIYQNFIRSIPIALDEAAQIDGCNKFQTFFKVILPQLIPVTVTIIIVNGVKIFNNYMISYYILQNEDKRVATTFVANFFTENPQLNKASAAALLSSLPVILIYLFLQKYFISGATEGIGK